MYGVRASSIASRFRAAEPDDLKLSVEVDDDFLLELDAYLLLS